VNVYLGTVVRRDPGRLRLGSDSIRYGADVDQCIGKRFSDQILFFYTDIDVSVFALNFFMFQVPSCQPHKEAKCHEVVYCVSFQMFMYVVQRK
jgi:hypothetical protein